MRKNPLLFLLMPCMFIIMAASVKICSPLAGQENPKDEIKKKRRDARYSRKGFSISNMGDGQIERSIVDYVEPDDYDAQTPDGKSVLTDAQKAAIRSKASAEAAAKRKSVTCDATIIVEGTVKGRKGYITSDNTNIYTVYQFIVTEVLRAPQNFAISPSSQIEVTVRGGFVKTSDGRLVGVDDVRYPQLSVNNTHLLALKYDAEADDYYPFNPIGMYKILPNGWVVRGDAKDRFLARRAHIAGEPNSPEAIKAEFRETSCQ
jgi:hypothetical protein